MFKYLKYRFLVYAIAPIILTGCFTNSEPAKIEDLSNVNISNNGEYNIHRTQNNDDDHLMNQIRKKRVDTSYKDQEDQDSEFIQSDDGHFSSDNNEASGERGTRDDKFYRELSKLYDGDTEFSNEEHVANRGVEEGRGNNGSKKDKDSLHANKDVNADSNGDFDYEEYGFKIPYPMNSRKFQWPVHGNVSKHLSQQSSEFNEGISISAPLNTPVHSASNGVVRYASFYKGKYGNLVIIEHPNGYASAYAHLAKIIAKKGQKVEKGQLIGYVGKTGDAKTSHLYFSIRKGEKIIDPEKRN